MAEKKKSIAEILAAARKTDSGDAGANDTEDVKSAPDDSGAAEPSSQSNPAESTNAPAEAPKAMSREKMSVADMLAAARAGAKGGEKPTESAKPAASKKPTPTKAKSADKKPAAAKSTGPKDTASILAAARKETKPGPMSKAEAAAKQGGSPSEDKPKSVVPPMPVRPSFAKGAAAKGAAAKGKKKAGSEERRSFLATMLGTAVGIGFTSLAAATSLLAAGSARFMFPNILNEPPSSFPVGFPGDFSAGQVETKYKAQFGVWIVNTTYNGQQQIYALKSVCTHLGCTPNWLEAEQKYKCPCHGSGFYKDGVNFEGPAPRPLERYAISIASDGKLVVDKSKKFQEELGQWENGESFVLI